MNEIDLKSLPRAKRFELMKKLGLMKGNRHDRKIEKFTDSFNETFNFFLSSYRSGILTFAGIKVDVSFNNNGFSGKEAFRRFEDGQFKNKTPETKNTNVLYAVITAKKSWGLFLNEWAMGIAEGSFTLEEIVKDFTDKNIIIPENLLKGFTNEIRKRKEEKWDNYLSGNKNYICL